MLNFSESIRRTLPLLLESTWQAALLALIVAAVCWIGRRHISPAWRFALWGLVFARLALPVLPGSPSSAFKALPDTGTIVLWAGASPADTETPANRTNADPLPDSNTSEQTFHDPVAAPPAATGDGPEWTLAAAALSPPKPSSVDVTARSPVNRGSENWWAIVGAVWLIGAALLICRQLIQWSRLRRLAATWIDVDQSDLVALLAACRHELRVRRNVRLMVSDARIGPAVSGLWWSYIVIPRPLPEQLSREQLRMVLLHELSHVRRWDVLWDQLTNLLVAVHWFNPVAWWARSQLRLQREQACDAMVLRYADRERQREYGRLVVELASRRPSPAWEVVLVGACGSPWRLKRRIDMIAEHRDWNWKASLLGGLLLTLGIACGLTRAESEPAATNAAAVSEAGADAGASADTTVQAVGYWIQGVCQDENEQPLAGVRVRVFRVDSKAITREQVGELETGATGEFEFPDLPAPVAGPEGYYSDYYVLAASRPGRVSWLRAYFSADSPTEGLELEMAVSGSLTGRVTDPDGAPIEGVEVFITSYPSRQPIDGIFSTTTDADGQYELSDLLIWDVDKIEPVDEGNGVFSHPSGCFYTVQHPDYATSRPMSTKVPDTIDVSLDPAAIIEGQVSDHISGQPAAGVIVSMQMARNRDRRRSGGAFQQVTTDKEGRYRLTSLSAGNYNIWADAAGRTCLALDSLSVEAGQTLRDADIQLIEGGWIEGRVVDAISAVPLTHSAEGQALRIGLHGPARPKTGAAVQSAAVGEDGRFRIQVAPGKNYPYIMVGDLWQRVERKAELDEGIDVADGEIVAVEFRVQDRVPRPTAAFSPVRLPVTVRDEREAARAVRDLGGWYQIDDEKHVVEVNMVYHKTADDVRYDNAQTETDEVLQWLPSFPRLKRLFLKEGQATNNGLAHVSGLKELEVFFIWDAHPISDAGIEHLRGLDKLSSIHISQSQISDQSLAVFGTLPALESLSLQGNNFSDDGPRHLVGLSQLKSLWIGSDETEYTDDIAGHLSKLTSLEELELQSNQLTDAGMSQLAPLTNLRSLYIGGSESAAEGGISDESLPVLLAMRELRQLSIQNTRLTDEAAMQLTDLPHLETLMLTVDVIARDAVDSIREEHPDLKLYVSVP